MLQLDIGRLAFVDTAAARERYQRLKQRMNTPRRIVARDKAAFVMGTLGLTCATGCPVAQCLLPMYTLFTTLFIILAMPTLAQ